MLDRNAAATPTPPRRGLGPIWVAVGCVSLSNLLSVAWIWSLVATHPLH